MFSAALMFPERAPKCSGAVCCRCHQWTHAPVPVRYIPRPSGAGVTLYACPSHAVEFPHGPTPGELEQGT